MALLNRCWRMSMGLIRMTRSGGCGATGSSVGRGGEVRSNIRSSQSDCRKSRRRPPLDSHRVHAAEEIDRNDRMNGRKGGRRLGDLVRLEVADQVPPDL